MLPLRHPPLGARLPPPADGRGFNDRALPRSRQSAARRGGVTLIGGLEVCCLDVDERPISGGRTGDVVHHVPEVLPGGLASPRSSAVR